MVSPMENPPSAIPQNTSSQHLDYNDDEERAQFIQICRVLGEDVDGKCQLIHSLTKTSLLSRAISK